MSESRKTIEVIGTLIALAALIVALLDWLAPFEPVRSSPLMQKETTAHYGENADNTQIPTPYIRPKPDSEQPTYSPSIPMTESTFVPDTPKVEEVVLTPIIQSTSIPKTQQFIDKTKTYTIQQNFSGRDAWFGKNEHYGNVEEGQMFEISKPSFLEEISVYLAYRPGGDNESAILCKLMDSHFSVIAETEIPGFKNEGGWKTFIFDPLPLIQPGIYVFGLETQGSYYLRFTSNYGAYQGGERQVRLATTNEWEMGIGDLAFRITLIEQ